MPQQEIFSSLPLALILRLERAEPKLAKFILSCDDNFSSQLLEHRRKYKPSHVVLLTKYHHRHEYSYGGVAILELNRIGVELKCKSNETNKMDDQGRLIRINDENGKPLGLFADEGSVNETHQVVISEWNDREMIFSQSMDLKERKFLKFKLNQKKVEESFVERVHVGVSHQLSHSLYRADHSLNVPVIGKAQNVLLTHLAFDRFSRKSNLAIFNIEKNEIIH